MFDEHPRIGEDFAPSTDNQGNRMCVEKLKWEAGGHNTMKVNDCIYPPNIQCKLSFEDTPTPWEIFYKL